MTWKYIRLDQTFLNILRPFAYNGCHTSSNLI